MAKPKKQKQPKPFPQLSTEPRCKPLWDWLNEHRASCMWMTALRDTAGAQYAQLEGWRIGAGVVVVQITEHGWSLLTEPSTNDVVRTLADAAMRVGLPSPPSELKPLDESGLMPDENRQDDGVGIGLIPVRHTGNALYLTIDGGTFTNKAEGVSGGFAPTVGGAALVVRIDGGGTYTVGVKDAIGIAISHHKATK